MDVAAWRRRNAPKRVIERLKHPWPLYKKGGGINAVVIHADGSRDDLGRVSDTYVRGWRTGSGH